MASLAVVGSAKNAAASASIRERSDSDTPWPTTWKKPISQQAAWIWAAASSGGCRRSISGTTGGPCDVEKALELRLLLRTERSREDRVMMVVNVMRVSSTLR